MNQWIKTSYARLLIDNHITEDDPSFMTRFDPAAYVDRVKQAGVDAAMVYACCHNGNCYYPTRVGHMHANLHGRDIFGETVNLLRQAGITPVAYYTTVYHNHSARTHPGWRMQDARSRQHSGRYWWSCPNNAEYRQFTRDQIGEVIAYDVDGIFVDMTFWPVICHCAECRRLYLQETGAEIPQFLDWRDPAWVRFQRFRQRSLVAFTQEITDFIKSQRDITVTHQNSLIIQGWAMGQTNGIADACDYASGDFYGGKTQHILGAKILAAASRCQPFEFMTSRCVNLNDHTSMKSEAELRCEAATTLASGGAYFFIDAINPDGTLEQAVYERLGCVSKALAPFTYKLKQLQPELTADTGLYFSMLSHVDEKYNGTSLEQLADNPWGLGLTPPVEEMTGTALILSQMHRPFRVVRDDDSFSDLQTLIVNDARFMSATEVERIRQFVQHGGTLLATGLTSLLDGDGASRADFALADVFGVACTGECSKRYNYLFLEDQDRYVSCNRPAPLVKPTTASVLAFLAEPLFGPDDSDRWASIHSNPPGAITPYAALTVNEYGKGKCIYLAQPVFAIQQDAQQSIGRWLFQQFAPGSMLVSTNAPACVEMTVLKSSTQNSYLVCFVNYQRELPNVPVHHLSLQLKLTGMGTPRSVWQVSDGKPLAYRYESGMLAVEVPYIETIEMLEVEF
jgi:hypothetical protein